MIKIIVCKSLQNNYKFSFRQRSVRKSRIWTFYSFASLSLFHRRRRDFSDSNRRPSGRSA